MTRHRIYMAGFGAAGRKPKGVHDPLYARLLVLRDGERTVGVVGLDILGLYRDDVEDIRRLSGLSGPGRYLFVAATHDHSGPDTLGLWGPVPGFSGVAAAYHREMKEKIAEALRKLEAQLTDVSLSADQDQLDSRELCTDSRDPVVIDPDLAVLSLRDGRGRTVATVVNWACHPEALGRDNRLLTADFPGALCADIEKATGGACLYLNGAIGGLLTPEIIPGQDGFAEARRIGAKVAGAALRLAAKTKTYKRRPNLSFQSHKVLIPVENSRYLLFLPALTFGHQLMDAFGRPLPRWKTYWLPIKHALAGLRPEERPWIETEVAIIDVGHARLLGFPGEVFPELLIGGYDGRYKGSHPLIKPGNPNPPDLVHAPGPPYLKELYGARHHVNLFVGLANDEVGYIVPEYDFKVRKNLLMTPHMPGDHYEETNSVGPSATRILMDAALTVLREADRKPVL
ncbi:MAG TPA: hypothetical protein DEB40_13540 [Elusimicrobia bacterium]|nr:hypothetical protein [Elusimicrobiota bacterium]